MTFMFDHCFFHVSRVLAPFRSKRFLILSALLLVACLASSQPSLVLTPIESSNGLLENRVRSLNQLPDGRMVVVTEGMINVYNGTSFQNIHINEEKVIPLSGYTGFHHTYIDLEDRLWLKNSGRLMLVDIKKESFDDAPEKLLRTMGVKESLSDFYVDSRKNLWFVTRTNKLLVREAGTGRLRTFITNVTRYGDRGDQLYDLALVNNVVFAFYRSGKIAHFDFASGKLLGIGSSLKAGQENVYSRTLYVIQADHSLYQIRNGERGLLQSYDFRTKAWYTLMETSYWLNSLVIDPAGNLWLSCRQGLWRIDKSLMRKQFIPSLRLVDGRSIKTEVSTVFIDRLGSLWIGTLNRGLLYYHPDRFKFKNIGKAWFSHSSDSAVVVTSLSAPDPSNILVGTDAGLFTCNIHFSRLSRFPGRLGRLACQSIFVDREGRTWVCTSAGLFLLNGSATSFYPVGPVLCVFESASGVIYLGTDGKGFGRFDLKTARYQPVPDAGGLVPSLSVSQLVEWNGKLIGIAGNRIFEYDLSRKALHFPHDLKNKLPMFRHNNHQYNALLKDSRGYLWFGTQDGLNVWEDKAQRLYRLHTTEGLAANNVKAITEDNKGRIWITTSNGISSVLVSNANESAMKFTVSNYNRIDGVIEGEFLERAACVTPNSYLLAGGIDGFNIGNTDSLARVQQSFKPLLSYFQLFGKKVAIGTAYDENIVLRSSLATTSRIVLKHNQNFFTIGFTALNYVNRDQTSYRYKLEGVDKSWRVVSPSSAIVEAVYTDIAPGTYVFKAQAASTATFKEKDTTTLVIEIQAPFWNTTSAKIIYLAAIIILFAVLAKYYLRRKHKQLVHLQKEKLDELKTNFFTNISHELRTPLTLILAPVEAILHKAEEGYVKQQLLGVQRNAAYLLELVNQLLEFRKLEETGEKLNLSYCDIAEYLERFCPQFAGLATSRKISFSWKCTAEAKAFFADKSKLDRIMHNLLANAFKFTPPGGEVSVLACTSTLRNEEALMISVHDTGIGIPQRDLPYVFNKFFQSRHRDEMQAGSGIGLHMVKEYVLLHGGTVDVQSEPNHGSTFSFCIPYNLKSEALSSKVSAAGSDHAERKARVLIVEDNEEFMGFLAGELGPQYHVYTAGDGTEGLNLLYELSPDIVISDVMMPGLSGIELCQKIKADIHISHTPVILLTAKSSDEAQIEGYEAGADAYISKPFSLQVLFLRIKKLLEQQEERKLLFKKAIVIQPDVVTTTGIDEKLVQRALKCVEDNIMNSNYSVELFSRDMNMDRTGLYRKLVSLTGLTPSGFIRSVRLKRAAILILQKEHTIGEVADLVGFNNAAYFSKAFQEEFGVKPSQYSQVRSH